uniref:Uncharacterized protein n=1 Tax=Pyramimonas orientalis virus TaxID=455367 RepID=A0A7M3UPB8_POV01|nr:hypothetical protein HWQ62_00466 [Pyramimonas orientalis virus]
MVNANLYTAYFTDEVCDAIRNGATTFPNAWKEYVTYHRKIDSLKPNAACVMNEFQNVFDELTSELQMTPADFKRYLASVL